MGTDVREEIREVLGDFTRMDLRTASVNLLNTLGYKSEKTLDIGNSPEAFLEEFDNRDRPFRKDKASFSNWKTIDFLFQITDDEIGTAVDQSSFDFQSGFDKGNYRSYLYFALALKDGHYSRTDISALTREINLLFDMPAMLLINCMGNLTLSLIDRRLHKHDEDRDVLEKVRLLKDIACQHPHRAHVETLCELSLHNIIAEFKCRNFLELHAAWRQVLNIEELNRQFYRRIQEWFYWGLQNVRFPEGEESETAIKKTGLIRLLTRIVFCWFAREKRIIPAKLFSPSTPHQVLNKFDPKSTTNGDYYKAILQNLFFPTLSVPLDKREFRNGKRYHGKNDHYMHHEYFRHESLFKDSEDLERLFSDIPFLNGGLFECLDSGTNSSNEIRIDGFSDTVSKQPLIPNILFFGEGVITNLSEYLGSKKSSVKVDGLFNILREYKFTITENTPIEEEVALDPELLGRIFENLLAEQNKDTETTARKETGSFYTPRTIVEYMVDVSLKGYLREILCKELSFTETDADSALDILFSYTEEEHPFTDNEKLTIVDAIHRITILDPACGSGAFPMGMLQRLVYILEKLDHGHDLWKQRILQETPAAVRAETEKSLNRSTTDYIWKLGLIQRCIYGIDIQPIAVQIAKLRCFISLLVDFDIDKSEPNMGVRALPNLDFKFAAADTLIRAPDADLTNDLIGDAFFQELAEEVERYFFVRDPAEKRKLRDSIESLIDKRIAEKRRSLAGHHRYDHPDEAERKELASRNKAQIIQTEDEIELWESYRNIFAVRNKHVRFFDSRYFFPEIKGGFDIVIGNPPYMRIQGIREIDPGAADYYKRNYKAATGSFDLYAIFTERGLELLKPAGILNYIMPDKWIHAAFGKGLRSLIVSGRLLSSLISLGAHKVFTACTYSSLIWLSRHSRKALQYARIDPNENHTDFQNELNQLSKDGFTKISYNGLSNKPWIIAAGAANRVVSHLQSMPLRLNQVFSSIYQGIASSKDSVYFLRDATSANGYVEAYSQELDSRIVIENGFVKPLLLGNQVHRYEVLSSDNVVVFPYEIPLDGSTQKAKLMQPDLIQKEYPKAWEYLKSCEDVIRTRERKRFDNEEWYQYGRKQGISFGAKPKLLAPDISLGGNFSYDEEGIFYTTTTIYGYIKKPDVPESYQYWLAILNSKVLWFYLKNSGAVLANGYYRYKPAYLNEFPIPSCTEEQEEVIRKLVDYILFLKVSENPDSINDVICAFLDELIDTCVMELYFPDHMAAKNLLIINEIQRAKDQSDRDGSSFSKREKIIAFYQLVNSPKHEIRNRLMRIPIDSPELLRIIKEV